MDVRTIKLEWEELDSLFENFFKEVLGKTIKLFPFQLNRPYIHNETSFHDLI